MLTINEREIKQMQETVWKYLWPVNFLCSLDKKQHFNCFRFSAEMFVLLQLFADVWSESVLVLMQDQLLPDHCFPKVSFTVAEKAITNNEVRETYGEIQPGADGLVNITNAQISQSYIYIIYLSAVLFTIQSGQILHVQCMNNKLCRFVT